MTNDLISKSVEELAPLIQNKSVSPVELTKAVLDHAEECEELINAHMEFYRADAEKAAKEAEDEISGGNYRGMYHGIPMALKDNIFFKEKVTTMSSKIHKDFVPTYDATVVEKLRNAGVIFTGKTNMHEYALGITNDNPHYGAVKNPWDLAKISGGSSGGSAAAVSAGSSLASIGTDTAGSIRIPSAACGIVGLKPTYGRVSTHGVFPLSWTLDHVGPMTKTVRDAAGLLEIIAGSDEKDATTTNAPAVGTYTEKLTGDVKDLVIGVEEDFFFNKVDVGIDQLVKVSILALVEKGAKLEFVKIPALKDAEWAGFAFSLSEAATIHYDNMLRRPQDFGEDIRGLLNSASFPSTDTYLQAQKVRTQLIHEFQEAFKKVDVLISPTTPILPSNIGQAVVNLNGEEVDFLSNTIRLTGPGNLTGIPTLSVPCGIFKDMPVGLQIMGPHFGEDVVLNVGYAIEKMNTLLSNKPSLTVNENK